MKRRDREKISREEIKRRDREKRSREEIERKDQEKREEVEGTNGRGRWGISCGRHRGKN